MPRRLLLLSLASFAVALPAAPASATSCPGADTTISALTTGSARAAVLCIVNAERTARGLAALTLNTKLQLAAQRHSEDMLARGYFAHEAPAPAAFGTDPGDRIDAAGYDWQSYGENIAAGYSTPREVMEAWMASEGHCHNILDPGFTELGVGVTTLAATIDGELGTWTQDFGRARGASAPGTNHGPQGACPYGALLGLDSPEPAAAPGSDDAPAPTAGKTPAPAGDEPARDAPAPADDQTPAPAAAALPVVARAGRALTIAGAAPAAGLARVQVTVLQHGRTIFRGTARVRHGRYRLHLRSVPRGRIQVRVQGGGRRVTRSIA